MNSLDIFCEVIDNFGDIGVAYRIAKEFKKLYGDSLKIRVFLNRVEEFTKINNKAQNLSYQRIDDIEYIEFEYLIKNMCTFFTADVIIEAFGCNIPYEYLEKAKINSKLLINLEYLSGESWVDEVHLLPSPLGDCKLKKYFYMQTPYFLPTEPVLTAMQTAALAGVDVRLMLPYRSDSRWTHLGSCSYLEDVLRAGVKVYLYKPGFLHSKMMVSDDELSTVGSTNIDFRSFEHNFEVNAFIYDMETALQMREIFLQDQRECVRLSLKNWVKRPWYRKVAESIVRLMSPLL